MRTVKLVLLLLICAVPATADELFTPTKYMYQATGSLTLVGNDVCSDPFGNPSPCTESFNFSFRLDWETLSDFVGEYFLVVLPGSTITSVGPLGSFGVPGADFALNSLRMGDAGGDEIDMDVLTVVESPIPPNLEDGYIYSCSTPACLADFAPPGTRPGDAIFFGGPFQVAVTPVPAVPEGSTLSLLTIGLVLLGVFSLTRPHFPFFNSKGLASDAN